MHSSSIGGSLMLRRWSSVDIKCCQLAALLHSSVESVKSSKRAKATGSANYPYACGGVERKSEFVPSPPLDFFPPIKLHTGRGQFLCLYNLHTLILQPRISDAGAIGKDSTLDLSIRFPLAGEIFFHLLPSTSSILDFFAPILTAPSSDP